MKHKKFIFVLAQLLVSITDLVVARACEVRGVSLENCGKYMDDFFCPSTKQIIPFDLVNDDYCDCPDSIVSDEPGTSACSSSTFHCENIGSFPIEIRSSIVNDGICDCCDGTDEWLHSNTCANECGSEVIQTYQELKSQIAALQGSVTIRDGLVKKADFVITKKEGDIENLKDEISGLQNLLKEQLEAKEAARAARRKAKIAMFPDVDPSSDGFFSDEEEEEELKDEHDDSLCKPAGSYLDSCSSCKQTDCDLSCTCNNGRGSEVESAIELGTCENFAVENRDGFLNCVAKVQIPPPPGCQPNGSYINSCKDCTQELCDLKCECTDGWVHKRTTLNLLTCDENVDVSNNLGVLECDSPPDGKPRKLNLNIEQWQNGNDPLTEGEYPEEKLWREKKAAFKDAHVAWAETQRKIRSAEKSIIEMEKFFEYDFGEDNILASIFSTCITKDIDKYTYEICAYEKVTQIENGDRTELGTFKELKRLKKGAYEMIYKNGKNCWEGLDRSTKVKLKCGTEELIKRVKEPETCVYKMQVTTPAACSTSKVKELKSELKKLTHQYPNLLKLE